MKSKGVKIISPVRIVEFPDGAIAWYSEIATREVWASYYGEERFFPVNKETLNELLKYGSRSNRTSK